MLASGSRLPAVTFSELPSLKPKCDFFLPRAPELDSSFDSFYTETRPSSSLFVLLKCLCFFSFSYPFYSKYYSHFMWIKCNTSVVFGSWPQFSYLNSFIECCNVVKVVMDTRETHCCPFNH